MKKWKGNLFSQFPSLWHISIKIFRLNSNTFSACSPHWQLQKATDFFSGKYFVSNRSHLQFWQIPFKSMTHNCIWSHSSALGSLYSSLYSRTVSHFLDKRKQTDKHNNITIALISCSATKASRAYSSAKRTESCKLIWLKLPNITSSKGSLSSQQPRVIHGFL